MPRGVTRKNRVYYGGENLYQLNNPSVMKGNQTMKQKQVEFESLQKRSANLHRELVENWLSKKQREQKMKEMLRLSNQTRKLNNEIHGTNAYGSNLTRYVKNKPKRWFHFRKTYKGGASFNTNRSYINEGSNNNTWNANMSRENTKKKTYLSKIAALERQGYTNPNPISSTGNLETIEYEYKALNKKYMVHQLYVMRQQGLLKPALKTELVTKLLDGFEKRMNDSNELYEFLDTYMYCVIRKVYWTQIGRRNWFTSCKEPTRSRY
jgi:hypothetical protein